MHKILLIEDDQVIRQQIGKMLSEWGFEVVLVEDFMEVLSIFVQSEPHLVLMDIGLPLFNGYHWCQEIRKISKVPIMFLSSRDQAMDIVMAINMGADDFVTKPFDQQVLLAKVQGLLRRSYEFGRDESLLEYAGVILNTKSMDLHYQGQVLNLTKNEFQILRVLFEHAGNIVARDDLMRELWNSDFFIDDNTLSVNVARLRKKLEEQGLVGFIETKKGIEYGLKHA
ncbi:TPA: response regulator transcription factor [Streptococcus pneumoniae]|nr:DNA-binding response regulator [Streptococcus pneumoniae]VSZ13632.1 DNA-binding response regulator [Streptococcus pneumoniae]HEW3379007.1 response regulator transcription factor [Streptococcus pneumoniae]HEW3803594.1 response regulator transcription factor [Streptococcus pneumoniae]HEW8422752.1 response regulator transcription factor [Streptococcus pneumoniae]